VAEIEVVVVTRSHLRDLTYYPQMATATLRVRRQLSQAPGVVRWASMSAGPREFWTITAWNSRHLMQEFMRSDAHGEIMWSFSRWLDSFWLTRWRPTEDEVGHWDGIELASDRPREEHDPAHEPEVAARALAAIPRLRAAFGGGVAAHYEHAPHVQRQRRRVRAAGALCVRLSGGRRRLPLALDALGRLRTDLEVRDTVFGVGRGVGRGGEVFLIAPWTDRAALGRYIDGPAVSELTRRWGGDIWVGRWHAEHELGHWDGRRLRRTVR
jgi:hypothetical protein